MRKHGLLMNQRSIRVHFSKNGPLENQSFSRVRVPCGKRGQMEIIGLVVIVILITLGMLFMAQFALKEKDDKKVFTRKGLAYSTMSALMKMDVKCEQVDYLEYSSETKFLELQNKLLQDCVQEYPSDNPSYTCGGLHPCEFINQTIRTILNQTLGTWNKHYLFRSTLLSGTEPKIILQVVDEDGNGCVRGDRDTSGLFPLSTNTGLVENVLYLCD